MQVNRFKFLAERLKVSQGNIEVFSGVSVCGVYNLCQ